MGAIAENLHSIAYRAAASYIHLPLTKSTCRQKRVLLCVTRTAALSLILLCELLYVIWLVH